MAHIGGVQFATPNGTVTTTQQQTNHADANAKAHAEIIEALYELACWDADQSQSLSDEANAILQDLYWDEDGTGVAASLQEALNEYVSDMPLSVRVRSDWHSPGETFEAAEFEILLSTGGPACRIIGELNRGSVERPVLQHNHWFEPWTESSYDIDTDALLWFCEQFYFGE